MDIKKSSRAAAMAATYAGILNKAGVVTAPHRQSTSQKPMQRNHPVKEVSWWQLCVGQIEKPEK